MKIFVSEKKAFVDLGKGYLLCIGTEEEVQLATFDEVMAMLRKAIEINKFHDLTTDGGAVN